MYIKLAKCVQTEWTAHTQHAKVNFPVCILLIIINITSDSVSGHEVFIINSGVYVSFVAEKLNSSSEEQQWYNSQPTTNANAHNAHVYTMSHFTHSAGAECYPLSLQPQHSPPTVDQTHLFRYHPILHDVDIPSLIEKDPILNAVESPVEEEVPLPATSTHQ